jgi:hypothetical protein
MRPALLATLAFLSLMSWSSAQVAAGASAAIATRYVWRGITRVNGWVLQPSAWLGVRVASLELSLSTWADLELRRAGAADLTQRGAGRRGLGELDLELAVARPLGAIALSVGWTRYTFHGNVARGGRSAAGNTSEVFLHADWRRWQVSPSLLAACDIDRVHGCHFETGVALPVIATPEGRPAMVLWLQPTAGWSAGQGPNLNDPTQPAHFAGNGLTHVDLPIAVQLQLPGGALEPGVSLLTHVQWCRDGATRITDAIGSSTRVKLWLELGVTVAAGLPRERRR